MSLAQAYILLAIAIAGEIISTGTCTGLTKVSSGDRVEAEFGPIGSISTWIVDAGSD